MKQVEIIIRQNYYGKSDKCYRLQNEDGSLWRGTHGEAQKEIESLYGETLQLSHNQFGEQYNPTYNLTYVMSKGKEILATFP